MFAFLHAGDVDQGRPGDPAYRCASHQSSATNATANAMMMIAFIKTRPDQTLIQNKPVCLGVAQGKL